MPDELNLNAMPYLLGFITAIGVTVAIRSAIDSAAKYFSTPFETLEGEVKEVYTDSSQLMAIVENEGAKYTCDFGCANRPSPVHYNNLFKKGDKLESYPNHLKRIEQYDEIKDYFDDIQDGNLLKVTLSVDELCTDEIINVFKVKKIELVNN